MDLHARLQLGGKVPSWLCGGKVTRDLGEHFEVGFNALHHRLGYDDVPNAKQWVNGDGITDLLAVKKDTVTLHLWNGDGFAEAVELGPGWKPYESTLMSLGDVNQNGQGGNRFGPAVAIGSGWATHF